MRSASPLVLRAFCGRPHGVEPSAAASETEPLGTADRSQLPRIAVLSPREDPGWAASLRSISPQLQILATDEEPGPEATWIYAPASAVGALSANALCNVLLCVAHQDLDFVVVSRGIEEPPCLRFDDPRDAVVLHSRVARAVRETGRLPAGSRGRAVRLLPAPSGVVLSIREPSALCLGPLECDGSELRAPATGGAAVPALHPAAPLFAAAPREVVLVLPIFMAVGGAERNLIEVLKALRHRYSFVLVTTERPDAARGSLHHQAIECCEALFDLGELAPQSEFMALLGSIAIAYRPSVVWICNGSPWLLSHTAAIRSLFRDIPIVDQQVYDTHAGWIEHYADPGIQSFDRFVAINQQIRQVFRQRIGIPEDRIDLIYHAIDADRFHPAAADACDREATAHELGLTGSGRRFGQVARLTSQKRPLDFLELARRSAEAGLDDRFVLIGDGELAGDCEAFITRHGLENVRRIPFCDDMSRLFPVLDGLVITSAYEGLPISMLEALAMGLPVLSTDVGDVGLVLRETGSGWTFARSGDADMRWAEFCRWRGELPQLRARARAAAAGVAERFSARTVAGTYERSWRHAKAERGGGISSPAEAHRIPAPVSLPPISVVIPTFNRAELLLETLDRCRECAGPVPLEFVVIDDGSRDDTAARLEELAGRMPNLTWRTGPNRGPGAARNLGASIARHDVLLFLGDDIQPKDDRFFRTHAEIHAQHAERDIAVLGKVTWPDRPWNDVNFVMAHVQGHRGEQFGYADLLPYGFVDWRFFYTANVSCKRALVDDWMSDGFSPDFSLAAYEDAEFAYRMMRRSDPLRIFYAPTSCGTHHHPYSVESFLERQLSAGMMARVFLDRHPNEEVRDMIGLGGVQHVLEQAPTPQADRSVADFLTVIEGVKAWARLVESQKKLGAEWWHGHLLRSVFHLAYLQGFVTASTDPRANVAGAYYFLLEEFSRNLEHVVHVELTGRTLGGGDIEQLFSARGGSPMPLSHPRLRAWARRVPGLRSAYQLLRRLRHAL